MGCICSKGINPNGDGEPHRTQYQKKGAITAAVPDIAISRCSSGSQRNVVRFPPQPVAEGENECEDGRDSHRSRKGRHKLQTVGKRPSKDGSGDVDTPKGSNASWEIVDVLSELSGEYAAVQWPAWLTSVAGEAIKGWQPRRAGSFERLDKIGQGTYSTVYRARDLITGKIVALKKVRFLSMDPESVRFMAREIHILRKLDHPNVIKLEGIVASQKSGNLYLVFEYMEHDLAGLAARHGAKFTEPQVKCYMQQLLEGLAHCHSKGVLHRDIKGSNLLIDNNGTLKIGDFGLAATFDPDHIQALTSHVVTLWYRPPELLLGATEYGVAVDLWSSGCILAELLAGKPIMPGRTEVEQLHQIFKLCGSPSDEYWKTSKLQNATVFKPKHQYKRCVAETFKDFSSSALTLLDSLLSIEPENRGTAVSALESEFFKTEPFACDRSSLPKYPPSKEYDYKVRNEEIVRRQKSEVNRERSESTRHGTRGTRAVPDANVEPRKLQSRAHKRNSRKHNAENGGDVGSPADVPAGTAQAGVWTSGMHRAEFGSSWSRNGNQQDPRIPSHSYSSVRVLNGPQLRTQASHRFSDATVTRSISNSRYNRLSDKRTLERIGSTLKKEGIIRSEESTVGYPRMNKRIHYSGPLMHQGGTTEDMLKEHERQIQEAVRKSRLEKRVKKY